MRVSLSVAVLALAAFLLYRAFSQYGPQQLWSALISIPLSRIALAGCFAAASYLCLTGFDWLAVRYAGHALPYRQAALASFVSLSLGHNIGFAALSSGAVRFRFYHRWGLSAGEVAKVILFCGVTVGLGLMILGGAALLWRPDVAQDMTGLGVPLIVGLGVVCLICALAYLLLAAFWRGTLRIRDWSLEMPALSLAAGQVVIGPLNFACVAACLYQALMGITEVSYALVATVYVIANTTALISHVPGGLGVIEGVVLFLIPGEMVIGALLVFRFVYFWVPLVIGALSFLAAEAVLGDGKP